MKTVMLFCLLTSAAISLYAQETDTGQGVDVTTDNQWSNVPRDTTYIRCHALAKGTLAHLVLFPGLLRLEIRRFKELNDADCKAIGMLVLLDEITCNRVDKIPAKFFSSAAKLKKLRKLSIISSGGDLSAGLSLLTEHEALEAIDLSSSKCGGGADIRQIAQLINLKCLKLDNCELVADNGIAYLADCKVIEEISLRGCHVTPRGVSEAFRSAEKLRSMSLPASIQFTDDALLNISALARLSTLDISSNPVVTGSGVAKCERLEVLNVAGCLAIDESGIQGIARLPLLRDLDLSRTLLSDKGCVLVAACVTLRRLNVSVCEQVSERGLASLSTIRLEFLALAGSTALNIQSIKSLAAMEQLTSLVADGCRNLDDGCIDALSACKKLRSLSVSLSSRLTCKSAQLFTKLPIESLKLVGCSFVDDSLLLALSECPNLKTLDVRDCKAVTQQGIEALNAANSSIRVIR